MNNDTNNNQAIYSQTVAPTQNTQTIIQKESYTKNFLMPYVLRFIFIFLPLTLFYLLLTYLNDHPIDKYILNPLCLFKPSIPNHLLIENYNIPTQHFQQIFPVFIKYYSESYKNIIGNILVGFTLSVTFYLLFSGKLRIFEKLFYMKIIFPKFTKFLIAIIFMPIAYWAFGPVVKNILIEANIINLDSNIIETGKNFIKHFLKM